MAAEAASIAGVLVVLLMVITILALVLIFASRYKKVPPNKAMVVYGRNMGRGRGYLIITGGGKFIMPIVEQYAFLPLDVRTLEFDLDDAAVDTAGGPKRARVKASAMFKIGSDAAVLDVAAEHLLGKPDDEIDRIARDILEGGLREMLASMDFEKLRTDRDAVALEIQQRTCSTLKNMGLEVRAFTFRELALKG